MGCIFGAIFLVTVFSQACLGAVSYDAEVKKFVDSASERYYRLYDEMSEKAFKITGVDDDLEELISTADVIQKKAAELQSIGHDARQFDVSKITDESIKDALLHVRRFEYDLFILGREYFESIIINFKALMDLASDKDIEPYLGGAFQPNQDDSLLAYNPDIEEIFKRSNNTEELKYYWEAFRNKNILWASVNFFTIVDAFKKASDMQGISTLEFWYRFYKNKDFIQEMEPVMNEIKPFYQQLHAFVRQKLFEKYGADVIDLNGPIPDHLFQQVLDQAWTPGSVIESYFPHSELPPYDDFVKKYSARELIVEAENFYESLGFTALDEKFHGKYVKELPQEEGVCRASVLDYTPNVFLEYCPTVDFRKFMQAHSLMAHVYYAKEKTHLPAYYFDSYDLHYPVGEAVILSASTPKHLLNLGLATGFKFTDNTLLNRLFRMGVHTVFNIPLYYVHNRVINDFFNGTVEKEDLNKYYWKLMGEYAGVEPPMDRGEESIDFPYRFYLELEQNLQTKKFVSEILGYQFYRALCQKSNQLNPLHNCDFYGNKDIGGVLKKMMSLGSSKPWREVIGQVLVNPKLSGDAMLEYYAPLAVWLQKKNTEANVKVGWTASKKRVV